MTRSKPALLLLAVVAAPLGAQQSPPTHYWATILKRADAQVELDTGAVPAAAGTSHERRVWLRLTHATGVPDFADIHIEWREVDCARPASRVLSTQDVSVFDGSRSARRPAVVFDSPRWIEPTRGSLDAAIAAAVCGGAKGAE